MKKYTSELTDEKIRNLNKRERSAMSDLLTRAMSEGNATTCGWNKKKGVAEGQNKSKRK